MRSDSAHHHIAHNILILIPLQLTADELALFKFSTALGDWLEPHHDYIRPPPSAVMSEVARLAEQKTGQQPKGFPAPENGSANVKKDEDPPAIQDPSEVVTGFFNSTYLPTYWARLSLTIL